MSHHHPDKSPCILRSRVTVFTNSQFEVYADHVDGAHGLSVSDWLTVAPRRRLPDGVTGVAIFPLVKEGVALLHVYHHAIDQYCWELPHGFIETGESSTASACRELAEETGFACEPGHMTSLGYLLTAPGVITSRIQLFLAQDCTCDSTSKGHEMGHGDLRVFSIPELEQMIVDSTVQDPCLIAAYCRYKLCRSAHRPSRRQEKT